MGLKQFWNELWGNDSPMDAGNIQKAASVPLSQNQLLDAQLRFLARDLPVMDIRQDARTIIENTYARNADVYAVINMIVRGALTVPKLLHEVNSAQAYQQAKSKQAVVQAHYKQLTKSEVFLPLRLFTKDDSIKEITSHPILDRLENPNSTMTGADLEEFSLAMYLICGNLYEYGIPVSSGPDKGKIWEVWNVYPQQIKLVAGKNEFVSEYEIMYRDVRVSKDKIMHLKMFNPIYDGTANSLYGMSPLYAGRFLVAASNAGYENIWKYNDSGGIDGIISPKQKENGANGLTPSQAVTVQETIDRKGRQNGGSKIHVSPIALEWQKVGDTMRDMQSLESALFSKRLICDLYGVSSALFNDANGTTFNNMSEARKALYTNAIIPLLTKYDKGRQNWFVDSWNKGTGPKLKLERDYSVIPELQPDKTALMQVVNGLTFLSENEKRNMFQYAPYANPAADQLYQSTSVQPLGEMEQAIADAQKQLTDIGAFDYQ